MARIYSEPTVSAKKLAEIRENVLGSLADSKLNEARFRCPACKCVFYASEYEYATDGRTEYNSKTKKLKRTVHCACPKCFTDCTSTTNDVTVEPSSSESENTETWYVQVLGRRVWWKKNGTTYARDNLLTAGEVSSSAHRITVKLPYTANDATGRYDRIWNYVSANYVKGTILNMRLSTASSGVARYWVKTKSGPETLSKNNSDFPRSKLKEGTTAMFYLDSSAYSGNNAGKPYTKP